MWGDVYNALGYNGVQTNVPSSEEKYTVGISGLFSFLALVGIALFLGGIALAVLAVNQRRTPRNGALLAVAGLILALLFSVISQGILIVQPQETAVVFNSVRAGEGGFNLEEPRGPGTHIILPWIQQVTIYPTGQQEYTMSSVSDEGSRAGDDAVDATTIDGQSVALDITIFYSIDPLQVNLVHQRWRNTYETYVRSTARTVVRDVVARYRAEGIYGTDRVQLQADINSEMAAQLLQEGLILNTLDVRGLNFSEQFRQAVEDRIAAEQRAQQAAFVVQQRRQEAEQLREQSAGERDAAIQRAEGEAQSIILRAEAEAEALRLVSEQIAANPSLIQYQYIQQLADNVQLALVPSDSPFLFSLDGLGVGNPDFVAPEVPQSNRQAGVADPNATATPTPGG